MGIRIVKTGLVGKKAYELMRSVIGQMSDGYWENTPGMTRFWYPVDINDNNEIEVEDTVFCSDLNYRGKLMTNPYYGKTDEQIRKFFANKIRFMIKVELEDNGLKRSEWRKDNEEFFTRYMSYSEKISVADAYDVFYKLYRKEVAA